MAWTGPSTVVVGQTMTAAFWNQQVRDNLNWLYGNAGPIYDSGAITAAAASFTVPASGTLPTNFSTLVAYLQTRSTTAAATKLQVQFNGDAGANYDFEVYEGSATTATAANISGQGYLGLHPASGAEMASAAQAANVATGYILTIPNYAGTGFFKNAELRFFGGSGVTIAGTIAGVWKSTAAVTSITFTPAAGNFAVGSRLIVVGLGAV